MVVLIKAAQLILSLSILVMVHEFGHFLFARLFNTKVEKFRLFFDPWFTIWKKKIGGTEYGLGWLPLGGYVKISGMIDESMDREQMKLPPKSWEFRSKKPYQRLLIMIGGVLFNVIFAVMVYSAVLYTWGDEYLPTENVKYGIVCSEEAKTIGFEDGDKIVSVDHKEVRSFHGILREVILEQAPSVQVLRDGEIVDVSINTNDLALILNNNRTALWAPRVPFEVAKFTNSSPAQKAGLQIGDRLIGLNGDSIQYFDQYLTSLKDLKNTEVVITVLRDGTKINHQVMLNNNGKLGVYAQVPSAFFEFKVLSYGLLESIPAGVDRGIETINDYLKQFKLIFTPETKAYESLGGFISIGSIFPAVWNWQMFWGLTAFLSIVLAIMNILPIPALDGGHVLLLLYEIITGRKPSDRFLEYSQMIGMVLLFGLLIFANLNDVIQQFK